MTEFTPLSAALGGALIGFSALILFVFDGRIAGISGILGNLLTPGFREIGWRLAFLTGLIGALVSGLVFGLGLVISQMMNPAKVLNFLDVAGHWDPSLAFVMAGAIPVAALGFFFGRQRKAPVFEKKLQLPMQTAIDLRLITGAALFGVGWGLVGFCPGPALVALQSGRWEVFIFVAAMIGGMLVFRLVEKAD